MSVIDDELQSDLEDFFAVEVPPARRTPLASARFYGVGTGRFTPHDSLWPARIRHSVVVAMSALLLCLAIGSRSINPVAWGNQLASVVSRCQNGAGVVGCIQGLLTPPTPSGTDGAQGRRPAAPGPSPATTTPGRRPAAAGPSLATTTPRAEATASPGVTAPAIGATPTPKSSPVATRGPTPVPTSLPPSTNTLFSDDFSGDTIGTNPPSGWTETGHWNGVVSTGDEHVLQHSGSPCCPGGSATAGSVAWTDYTLAADIGPFPSGSTALTELVVRYRNDQHYYGCSATPDSDPAYLDIVLRSSDPNYSWISPLGRVPNPGTTLVRMWVTASGSTITCGVGANVAATYTGATILSGQIGMYGNNTSQGSIGNVVVTAPQPSH